jgi:hypothetical protein
MLQTTEVLPTSRIDALVDDCNAFVERFEQQHCDRLAEFQDRMSSYENQADEMLTKYAEALKPVESLSVPQFEADWRSEPDWRMKMLKVVQELFAIPRWIFRDEFPQEFKSLRSSYIDFVMETDAMGEDMLEFMIAVERHDLKEVNDLFSDLHEGLDNLETMLTTRWREIARLSRELETSNKLAERWPVPAPVMPLN